MIYLGAREWFFWLGVEAGLNAKIGDMDEAADNFFFLDTETGRDIRESFNWGFSFGLVLTPKEFLELTTYPEPVIIDLVEEKIVNEKNEVEGIVLSDSNFVTVGNC